MKISVSAARFTALGVSSFVLLGSPQLGWAQGQEIPLEPVRAPLVAPDVRSTPAKAAVRKPLAQWSDAEVKALGQGVAFPHELLDLVLTKYVSKEGDVMYAALKDDFDLELYKRALALAELRPNSFPVFQDKDDKGNTRENRNSELAFWINAYNGLFLEAVGEQYPVDSVSKISDFDGQKTRVIGGQSYSFAELRKKIAALDARAMFVLLDGTRSGPRAPQAAARYFGLNSQLNGAIKAYVNDPLRVTTPNRLQNEVTVSPWLRDNQWAFSKKSERRKDAGIRQILAGYTAISADQRYFAAGDYEIKFMRPNNALNGFISR